MIQIKNLLNKYTIPIIIILVIGIVIYLLKKRDNFIVSRLGKELVFFSMDGCQHCENMRPIYELLRKNYGENQYIEIKEIKSSERPEIIKKHQINAFPTIAYLKNGNLKNKHEGKMDYEDLVRFMNYSISN
jgi:thiol-disulfide isomerase/thioredoxin